MSPAKKDIAIRPKSLTFMNAQIMFRNFSGAPGKFNAEGKRNFALFLTPEAAEAMIADNWNVKYLKPREEDDVPQAMIAVNVKYGGKGRPPRVVIVTQKGKTEIGEDMLDIVDWMPIIDCDLIINPYFYDVSGRQGYSAYLQSIYVKMLEDELDIKYADVPDTAQSALADAGSPHLAIEAGDDSIYVDFEEVNG